MVGRGQTVLGVEIGDMDRGSWPVRVGFGCFEPGTGAPDHDDGRKDGAYPQKRALAAASPRPPHDAHDQPRGEQYPGGYVPEIHGGWHGANSTAPDRNPQPAGGRRK